MMHDVIQKFAEQTAKINISKQVSPEERDRRLNICVSCKYYKDNHTCNKCGCYMPEKVKWEYITGYIITCPMNFWQ